jgi:hypothetical protein
MASPWRFAGIILETSVDRLSIHDLPHKHKPLRLQCHHPLGNSTTQPLAHLVGRPALTLLLAGMSLPRRRFAPAIPPRRTSSGVQLRFQGLSMTRHRSAKPASTDRHAGRVVSCGQRRFSAIIPPLFLPGRLS